VPCEEEGGVYVVGAQGGEHFFEVCRYRTVIEAEGDQGRLRLDPRDQLAVELETLVLDEVLQPGCRCEDQEGREADEDGALSEPWHRLNCVRSRRQRETP